MSQDDQIDGERTDVPTLVARTTSARRYRTVALGLLACVTVALAAWYVSHVRANAADSPPAHGASRTVSSPELKLPPLGPPPPRPVPAAPVLSADGAGTGSATPAVQGRTAPHALTGDGMPLRRGEDVPRGRDVAPVMVRSSPAAAVASTPVDSASPPAWSIAPGIADLAGIPNRPAVASPDSRHPAANDAVVLPDRRFLLPRGSFLDCTLETAIDSTLPGLATCILASDVYGADGRVVLMERGTRLVGETRSDVRSGQNRVAVQWQDARTPAGVRIDLDSAATDALGRTGLPGQVDRHLADRFGAAALLSLIDAGASAIAARHGAAGAIVFNPQSSRDIATEALRGTIGIPPTIRVEPGARVQVIVAGDINFRNVYRLVAHDPG